MSLDLSNIGRSYPPSSPYLVSREKIREFATAIGADDVAYHDADSARALGFPDVIAPPTFPILVSMGSNEVLIQDAELGLDFSRVVHGDQRFNYTRPVYAGDHLVSVTAIDDITSRGGHDFLSVSTVVTTVAGEPVVTAYLKLVVRGED